MSKMKRNLSLLNLHQSVKAKEIIIWHSMKQQTNAEVPTNNMMLHLILK